MDDDLFLAATGSGTIAVVSSSGASVDLNNPAHHGQGDGILGFDVDPRTGVIVTGSFNGAVNVMSVNFREHHSLSDTPVRTLRKMLARRGASAAGCIEKSDIVKRVRATGACPLIRLEATLPRHGATVVSTSICGRMFATGSNDGTAKIGRMDPSVLYRFQDPPEDEGEEEGGKKGKSGGKAAGAGSGVSAASGKHDSAGASGKRAEIVRTIDPQVSASSTEAGAAADGESPAIDVVFLQKTVMHTGDKASFLKRYDVETGALLQSWDTAHGWVWSVCPTETTYREFEDPPEDCRVVLTGGTDAVVRVWDSRVSVRHSPEAARSAGLDRVASQPVTQLRLSSGSQAPVAGMQVCWSKNTVYAASFDGNLHVLDVRAPGSCVPTVAEEWWGYEPNLPVQGKAPAESAGAGSAPATGYSSGSSAAGMSASGSSAAAMAVGGSAGGSAGGPAAMRSACSEPGAGAVEDVTLSPLYKLQGVPLPAATRQLLIQQLGVPNERLCRVGVSPRSVAVGSFDGRVHLFTYGSNLWDHSTLDDEARERMADYDGEDEDEDGDR